MGVLFGCVDVVVDESEEVVLVEGLVLLEGVHHIVEVGWTGSQFDGFGEVECVGGLDEGFRGPPWSVCTCRGKRRFLGTSTPPAYSNVNEVINRPSE